MADGLITNGSRPSHIDIKIVTNSRMEGRGRGRWRWKWWVCRLICPIFNGIWTGFGGRIEGGKDGRREEGKRRGAGRRIKEVGQGS